jgi:serine protease Do
MEWRSALRDYQPDTGRSNKAVAERPMITALESRWRSRSVTGIAGALILFVSAAAWARPAPTSFADLSESLSPSVVNISTTTKIHTRDREPFPQFPPGSPFEEYFKDFFDRQQRQKSRPVTSLGSGFVVDPKGYVVTNNHVIAEADEITIKFSNGETLDAEIVGRDAKTDLALLKVEPKNPLPAVSFGDSDKARVGDWVLAIGNPFGLGGTVTAGIISARNRNINAGPYDDFIQTDAPINRGNSGGPLFNMSGQVIGVNSAIYSPTGGSVGIGFAIPSALAKQVVAQLREYGETRRGWLGVRIQTVTDEIAESLDLKKTMGALVAGLTPGGPAEEAGIEQGDVILKFDGKDVPDMRALPRIVAETPIGKEVEVEVWRDGKKVDVEVEIARLEEGEQVDASADDDGGGGPAREGVKVAGMTLRTLSASLRERYDVEDDVSGVMVVDVDRDSDAGRKGVRPGDMILTVGSVEAGTAKDAADAVDEARKSGKNVVLLYLYRSGDRRYVAVRIDENGEE